MLSSPRTLRDALAVGLGPGLEGAPRVVVVDALLDGGGTKAQQRLVGHEVAVGLGGVVAGERRVGGVGVAQQRVAQDEAAGHGQRDKQHEDRDAQAHPREHGSDGAGFSPRAAAFVGPLTLVLEAMIAGRERGRAASPAPLRAADPQGRSVFCRRPAFKPQPESLMSPLPHSTSGDGGRRLFAHYPFGASGEKDPQLVNSWEGSCRTIGHL